MKTIARTNLAKAEAAVAKAKAALKKAKAAVKKENEDARTMRFCEEAGIERVHKFFSQEEIETLEELWAWAQDDDSDDTDETRAFENYFKSFIARQTNRKVKHQLVAAFQYDKGGYQGKMQQFHSVLWQLENGYL